MAQYSTFEKVYGRVATKSICSLVHGTVAFSKSLGEVFIACKDEEQTEKAFHKLVGKGKVFSADFVHDFAIFQKKDVACKEKATEVLDASNWEVMDTAPRDGTEVILLVQKRAGIPHQTLVGHYMEGGHCIQDHPPIYSGWYFWNGCMFDSAATPLMWMPLPELPEKFK